MLAPGALIAAAVALLAARTDLSGILADGYVYLLMADALRGVAAPGPDWRFLFGHYPFPPVYPAYLAAWGAGADAPQRAFLANAAAHGIAFVALAAWYRRLGLGRSTTLGLLAVFALVPATWLTMLDIQSEALYLPLTVLVLLLAGGQLASADSRPASRAVARAWTSAGLFCAIALLTRTAGLALFAAFALSWLHRQRPGGIRPLLIAGLPWVVWQLFKALAGFDASYLTSLPSDWGELPVRLAATATRNLRALAWYGPRSFDLAVLAPPAAGVVTAGAVLALFTFLRRLRRMEFDALYVLLYTLLIMAWPHPDHMRRFLWVVLPLLLGYTALALGNACATRGPRWLAPVVLAAFLGALVAVPLPGTLPVLRSLGTSPAGEARELAQSPARYGKPAGLRAARLRRAAFAPIVELLDRARRRLPEDACIASAIPEQAMFHARRRGLDLVHARDNPRAQLAQCPYLLAVAFRSFPDNGVAPMFPYHLLRAELDVLDVAPVDRRDREAGVRAVLAHFSGPQKH